MNTTHEMSLNEDITIGCAFRYALGRMTYVVDSVASEIERSVDRISVKTKSRMIAEIHEAIKNNQAGMTMDVERWAVCQNVLRESIRKAEA